MGEWKLKKNVSSTEMENIVRIQGNCQQQHDKNTRFEVRGRSVAQDDIDRYLQRQSQPRDTNPDAMPSHNSLGYLLRDSL